MIRPKKWVLCLLSLLLSFTGEIFAAATPSPISYGPNGWAFDVGGQYTWMSLTTPPTYSGSTGGVIGKITYQNPWALFGQARTVYNLGPLNSSSFYELYIELVGGYCFSANPHWTFTPYVGTGFDFITNNLSTINLGYDTYYALIGFDSHYAWKNCTLGLQFDFLPIFNQYLEVTHLPEADWTLTSRVGFNIRLPVAYKIAEHIWMEIAPYYRWFPIGESDTLLLPERNLNQWGAFLTFRFLL